MKKKLLMLILSCTLLLIAGCSSQEESADLLFPENQWLKTDLKRTETIDLNTESDLEDNQEAVGVVTFRNEAGEVLKSALGFIIDPSGIIVTNAHHADEIGCVTGEFHTNDGKTIDITKVLNFSHSFDLTVLQLKERDKDYPFLVLGDASTLKVDDEVTLYNPTEEDVEPPTEAADGEIYKKVLTNEFGYHRFLVDAPDSSLSMGSPVMNEANEVVGVIEASADTDPDIKIAAPVAYIQLLLQEANTDTVTLKELNDTLVYRSESGGKGEVIKNDGEPYLNGLYQEGSQTSIGMNGFSNGETVSPGHFTHTAFEDMDAQLFHYYDFDGDSTAVSALKASSMFYYGNLHLVDGDFVRHGLGVNYSTNEGNKNLHLGRFQQDGINNAGLMFNYEF